MARDDPDQPADSDQPLPPTPACRSRGSASVLLNGLHVLEAFSIDRPVLGVTEIARRINLHKSTGVPHPVDAGAGRLCGAEDANCRFRLGLGPHRPWPALPADTHAGWPTPADLRPSARARPRRSWGGTVTSPWWSSRSRAPKQVKHTAAIGTRYDTYESASVRSSSPTCRRRRSTGLRAAAARRRSTTSTPSTATCPVLTQVREEGHAFNDGRTSAEEVGVAALFATTADAPSRPCCCRLRGSGSRPRCSPSWRVTSRVASDPARLGSTT